LRVDYSQPNGEGQKANDKLSDWMRREVHEQPIGRYFINLDEKLLKSSDLRSCSGSIQAATVNVRSRS
jgi:hypothetical protein